MNTIVYPGGYLITTDRSLMSITDIHDWLANKSHWAKGIPMDLLQRAYDNSFVAAAIKDGKTIGFARLVTDYAIFAYLADVFVVEEHRGLGISKAITAILMDQPWVADIRRLMLSTKDAHSLYARFGFKQLQYPDRIMEILRHHSYIDPHFKP